MPETANGIEAERTETSRSLVKPVENAYEFIMVSQRIYNPLQRSAPKVLDSARSSPNPVLGRQPYIVGDPEIISRQPVDRTWGILNGSLGLKLWLRTAPKTSLSA